MNVTNNIQKDKLLSSITTLVLKINKCWNVVNFILLSFWNFSNKLILIWNFFIQKCQNSKTTPLLGSNVNDAIVIHSNESTNSPKQSNLDL